MELKQDFVVDNTKAKMDMEYSNNNNNNNNGNISANNGGNSDNSGNITQKGRGFNSTNSLNIKSGNFDTINVDKNNNIQKSVEGYVIFITGLHSECNEDDIHDTFSEYGTIKQLSMPLDRRTGFVKGYALLKYNTFDEANDAIKELNGTQMYNNTIFVDWAFIKPPK